MADVRPRRSALYMPASNPRAIAKARMLACDVVILDLEDAVAPDCKADARTAAVTALSEGFGPREVVIRINALDTAWGHDDLAAITAARPDAVLLPKVRTPADIAPVAATGLAVWAMIETPYVALHLAEIAAAPGLAALVLGLNDLAEETGAMPGADRLPFQPLLTQTVLAARAYGLTAFDGVYNAIDDAAGFAAEATEAARFGFDGKTLIHPSQVEPCNTAFSPTPEAVARAERIVAAFDDPASAGQGAIRVAGEMVERLHLTRARQIFAQMP